MIPPYMAAIIRAVCKYFGYEPADILGTRRPKHLSMVRHIAMYLAYEWEPNNSHLLVAHAFNRSDHTTSLFAHAKVLEAVRNNEVISNHVNQCRHICRALISTNARSA